MTHPSKRLKPLQMTLDNILALRTGEPPVAVHHKGDMFRYRSEREGGKDETNEESPEVGEELEHAVAACSE